MSDFAIFLGVDPLMFINCVTIACVGIMLMSSYWLLCRFLMRTIKINTASPRAPKFPPKTALDWETRYHVQRKTTDNWEKRFQKERKNLMAYQFRWLRAMDRIDKLDPGPKTYRVLNPNSKAWVEDEESYRVDDE